MTSDRKFPPAQPASRSAARKADDPIAMGLRRLWADVESEAVPDDFLNLLDEIDSRRAGGAGNSTAGDSGEKGGE